MHNLAKEIWTGTMGIYSWTLLEMYHPLRCYPIVRRGVYT